MGRSLIACALTATATTAHASPPPISLQLGLGSGVGHAALAGTYVDDTIAGIRAGVGVGELAALDLALAEDTDRVEAAVGVGVRVRPWTGPCWHARWEPYLRASASLVGASHLGSNFDLLGGVGHWGHLAHRVGWFAEVDVVARVGEVETLSLRGELGVAFTTDAFWR